ncbi:hypothetical protein EVAR_22629_1 [Eumeta japonica]|uniref:Uncharacterized protein n=1 Tax=Eumeta variegata TaxID=151549 RepID=A0A4C1VN87_EUMVA|nr:hypothetical protein EVAR_22629_1 [Eumeta japonica]
MTPSVLSFLDSTHYRCVSSDHTGSSPRGVLLFASSVLAIWQRNKRAECTQYTTPRLHRVGRTNPQIPPSRQSEPAPPLRYRTLLGTLTTEPLLCCRSVYRPGPGPGLPLACHLRDTPTQRNSAVPGCDHSSYDVFVDECLVLLDVNATVQDDYGGFDRSDTRSHPLDDTASGISSQLANVSHVGTSATAILRLSASTSSSEVANLLRCRLDWLNRRNAWSVFFPVDKLSAV